MSIFVNKSKKTKGKGMTLGELMKQKKKQELNIGIRNSIYPPYREDVEKEVEKKSGEIDLPKLENRVERKVQCTICDEYFVTDIEMDDDICNKCWPLVNSK